jgi:regulator of cell morphogenesis and NO signaling
VLFIQIKNVEMERIENTSNQGRITDHDFEAWNCDFMADYIVQTHHQYEINAIPQIQSLIDRVVEMHGANHSELKLIKDLFGQLSNELLLHMQKEELVLFPFIKKLTEAESSFKPLTPPAFGSVKSPISVMNMEHQTSSLMLNNLKRLGNDYQIPDDADTAFHELYINLKVFDNDLRRHIHIEDNILFPKTIELEKSLLTY